MGTSRSTARFDGRRIAAGLLGHLLIENRHGLIAGARATVADCLAEREAATLMIAAQWERAPRRRRTVAADKAYDVADFVGLMRELNTTPHVAQNLARRGGSAIDARTTRHRGIAKVSMRARGLSPRLADSRRWRGCAK